MVPPDAGGEASSQDDIDALLAEAGLGDVAGEAAAGGGRPPAAGEGAQSDIDTLLAAGGGGAAAGAPMQLEDLGGGTVGDVRKENLSLLLDVHLNLKVELGRTRMYLEDILKLASGSVVELEKLAGDPLDILVNDRLVARGEVLVLNDNFCVRITEILPPGERVHR